jgi:hypothetical protein
LAVQPFIELHARDAVFGAWLTRFDGELDISRRVVSDMLRALKAAYCKADSLKKRFSFDLDGVLDPVPVSE